MSTLSPAQRRIVEAAQRICASITEEDVHRMSDLPFLDTLEKETEFCAAMLDLGQAVQDLEVEESN